MLPTKVKGVVTRFKGNGRRLGYPTANLTTGTSVADGVYFGHADLNEFINHPAIIFIGEPTTLDDHQRRIEAYLLDIPDVDCYDQDLVLRIEHFHRSNQTFDDVDMLLKEMANDEAAARDWFSNN